MPAVRFIAVDTIEGHQTVAYTRPRLRKLTRLLATKSAAITFELDREGRVVQVDGSCHCHAGMKSKSIRRTSSCVTVPIAALSGNAFRVVVAATPGTFRLIKGEPKTYVKISESGNRREQNVLQ